MDYTKFFDTGFPIKNRDNSGKFKRATISGFGLNFISKNVTVKTEKVVKKLLFQFISFCDG
jgi:adenine C2-methylase RlmN of 23S rRNA A2503 and tRNA A37